MNEKRTIQATGPTVYYDGSCPLCRREISFYRRRKSLADVSWVDVAACEETDLPVGITREKTLARFHVKLPDGSLVTGPSAFGVLWLRMKGFTWFGRILQLDFMQPTLEILYRLFLKLRFALLSRLNTKAE